MAAPRTRKSPEVRRQEILEALIAVATVRGLDGITVRDVAQHAKVAPGLIHHYFPSLDELLTTAFGEWADHSLRRTLREAENVSPRMALALLVADTTPEQRLWSDALSTACRSDLLKKRARDLSISYRDHVEALIRTGVGDGTFTCADPRATAWRVILILDGLVPMVHVLGLIALLEVPSIIGPVIESELGLAAGSFTELALAATRQSQTNRDFE
jgi:AcrR family transcriptional regulator